MLPSQTYSKRVKSDQPVTAVHARQWLVKTAGGVLGFPRDSATGVAALDPKTGRRAPIYVKEPAPWSAVRNATNAYGFAAFSVDPGDQRGGLTSMKVTYYDVVGTEGQLIAFESFTLRRMRRD